jgi:solute carrier family 25 carnitine/acylcarnitine transporter 20/29
MRASTKLNGTPFEMTEGTATFLSGGLASFTFWTAAIPADNVKKCLFFTSPFCLIAN